MDRDLFDYPGLYLYDNGAIVENPVKWDRFAFYEC